MDTISFGSSSGKLQLLGLYWLVQLAIGVSACFAGLYFSSQNTIFGLVLAGTGVILALVSVGFLSDVWFRMNSNLPTIEVSADGFLDRRLSREPIPWDEIAGIPYYWYRQRSLAVILKDSANPRISPILALRLMERYGKMLDMPGYTVIVKGSDATIETVEAAIRRFAPELVRPA
ncbi:MAG: hypothetical protein H6877_14235 [Rhodobiaceae bacterium]|nr:hypothetical protein [Rhodobiaceae bacterium]